MRTVHESRLFFVKKNIMIFIMIMIVMVIIDMVVSVIVMFIFYDLILFYVNFI